MDSELRHDIKKRKPKYNIVGKQIHDLHILEEIGHTKGKEIVVKCRCKCGKICKIRKASIIRNQTRSCGCRRVKALKERRMRNSKKPPKKVTGKERAIQTVTCFRIYKGSCIEGKYKKYLTNEIITSRAGGESYKWDKSKLQELSIEELNQLVKEMVAEPEWI